MKKEREKYRAVFNSDIGIEVLNDMAIECGFYSNLDMDEDRILFNYFRSLLEKIGIFDAKYVKGGDTMRKLMELPIVPEEK